jgi:hypothetical protein
MNIHTFKDVVTSKRSSLAHDLDNDDDDDYNEVGILKEVEGEEENGQEEVVQPTKHYIVDDNNYLCIV